MGKTWGERRGSNPRHLGPQPSALPAELRPPCAVQGRYFTRQRAKSINRFLRAGAEGVFAANTEPR